MNDYDCQKNIKKAIEDGLITTVDATIVKKPIGDGLLITTVATTTAGISFSLRAVGAA